MGAGRADQQHLSLTSSDALHWTRQESGTTHFLSSLTAFPGGLVAVGENGALLVGSSDGTAWTPRDAGTARWLYRVRYLRNELVVVGEAGTLLRSADGTSWTVSNTGTSQWLNDVVWVEDRYYAAGAARATRLNRWPLDPAQALLHNALIPDLVRVSCPILGHRASRCVMNHEDPRHCVFGRA